MDLGNLASNIIDKGLENTDLSMLPWEKKMSLLTDVAVLYRKRGNFDDAVKALVMSGNMVKMKLWSDDLMELKKIKHATICAIPLKESEKLEKLGVLCLNEGYYRLAAEAFKAIGRNDMAEFVRMNFLF